MRYTALALAFATAVAVGFALPSRAAPNSHVGAKADDIVNLLWECNTGTPTRILSNGDRVTDFAIPHQRLLVITDIEWRAAVTGQDNEGESFVVEIQLADAAAFSTPVYLGIVPIHRLRGSLSDHLTSALVVDSSVTLDNDIAASNPRLHLFGVAEVGPASICQAILRGYLINQ